MSNDDMRHVADAIHNAEELQADPHEPETTSKPSDRQARSATDQLLEIVKTQCVFFHDPDGRGYARIAIGGHRECWPISSPSFKDWLNQEYFEAQNRAAPENALTAAVDTLEAHAKYKCPEEKVYIRVATECGSYWMDLGDDCWSAIRWDENGWETVEQPPINFVRTTSTRSLPVPVRGGSLDHFYELANVTEEQQALYLVAVTECYRENTPNVLIELVGQQGTSKSTTQDMTRRFIDPNKSNLRAPPKSTEDLVAATSNAHILSLENVSHLSDEQQDDLCRLTTGSGFAKRKFYTDHDEDVVYVKRPVLLNGISANVTRPDLLDRTVSFHLSKPQNRRTARELEDLFEQKKSGIFGALLDLAVAALARLQHLSPPENLPRMADFALWGEAVYQALGHSEGSFLEDYEHNRRRSSMRVVESSPVALAVRKLIENVGVYEGTISQLLEQLEQYRPRHGEAWPKSPRGLSDQLRRSAPALQLLGITLEDLGHRRDGTWVRLEFADPER